MSDAAEIIQTIKGRDGTYLPKSIERNERLARGVIPKLMRVIGRARDPLTPMKAKAVLFAAVAYFVMPVDALPDIVVGLGFTDDATVLATALGVVGMYVKERHRRMARRLLRLPEPVKQAE